MVQIESGPRPSRLPWIDEVQPVRKRASLWQYAGWLVAAALLAGGGAYVLTLNSSDDQTSTQLQPSGTEVTSLVPPTTAPEAAPSGKSTSAKAHSVGNHGTVAVPSGAPAVVHRNEPGRARRQVRVSPAAPVAAPEPASPRRVAAPSVRPTTQVTSPSAEPPAAPSRVAPAAPRRVSSGRPAVSRPAPGQAAARRPRAAQPTITARPAPRIVQAPAPTRGQRMLVGAHPIPRPFNPAMLNGPKVQLGAFAQLRQANAVWKAAVKAHPPLGQIQPAIIQNRAWNGQAFYQFEIGTNSVADAQLLCQWMARANFRCTVVAPPWTRR